MAFVHVWNEWLAAEPRDHLVNAFIRASDATSLHELQRFLENPKTIQQLTYIDPTDRLTNQLNEDQREDLLALPHILDQFYKEEGSIKRAHSRFIQLTRDNYEDYLCRTRAHRSGSSRVHLPS